MDAIVLPSHRQSTLYKNQWLHAVNSRFRPSWTHHDVIWSVNLYLFRLHCCIIFINVQVVIIIVVVIVVIVVVVIIVVVVADHIDDGLHGDEDEGGEAKGGKLGARGAKWLALL